MIARVLFLLSIVVGLSTPHVHAQSRKFNYEEDQVPKYELPDPLEMSDGSRVTTAKQWTEQRRGEVLNLFADEMYGRMPNRPAGPVRAEVAVDDNALGGTAIRKQIKVYFTTEKDSPSMDILVYLPRKAERPVPIFLGLNFYGNQTVHKDSGIRLTESWVRNNKDFGITKNRATEASRGVRGARWQVEKVIAAGYGLATIYYGDIDPDFHDGFRNGVHALFAKKGRELAPNEWGSISAWAWGLSLAVDYLVTDKSIDAERIVLLGHSRLGKTSLWAGANDPRFAIVISNNSGCGGAALSRRQFGETVARINTSFPHWFCGNFKKYNDKEDELPIDQHMLVALVAPRPVLINSAVDDGWADPHGEFLAAKGADSVYRLLGTDGIAATVWPKPNKLIKSTIGYHLRPGKHDVTERDWDVFLEFANHHFQ